MGNETKGEGKGGATDLPVAEQLDSLRSDPEDVPGPISGTPVSDDSTAELSALQEQAPAETPEVSAFADLAPASPAPSDEAEADDQRPADDALPHTADEGPRSNPTEETPIRLQERSHEVQLSQSEEWVTACSEVFAVAKTALDELNRATAPYLSFQQKKRIHSHAARFIAEPVLHIPTSAISDAPRSIEKQVDGGSVSVEELERLVLRRVQDRLGSELSILANRAQSTAVEAGSQSEIGEKIDWLAGALRGLERSLPERIEELIESKLSSSGLGAVTPHALLSSVDEVRSVRPGFSITDLDLVEIAALSDRANQSDLPALDDHGEDDFDEEDELVVSGSDLPSDLPPPEESVTAHTAVVYMEEEGEPGAPHLDDEVIAQDDAFPSPEDTGVIPDRWADESGTFDETGLESIEMDMTSGEFEEEEEPVRLQLEPQADTSHESVDFTPGEASDDGLETVRHDADAPVEAEVSDELPRPTPTQEDLVLAPVVGEEESVVLELGDELDSHEEPAETTPEPEDEGTSLEPVPAAEGGGDAPLEETEAELRLQHAAELRGRGKLAEAMQQYDEVVQMGGPNYEAHIGRGVVYLQTRDYERAAREFASAESIDSTRPAGALGMALRINWLVR